jgi:hypothetical protein
MSRKRLLKTNQYNMLLTLLYRSKKDGTVVPMRTLLDTGTTSTIILREFVGKFRAHTNTKKRTKWKALGGTFTTNYESLFDFKFPEISTSKVVTWQAHVDDKLQVRKRHMI